MKSSATPATDLPATPRKRLFFALWPDEAVRKAVVRLLRNLPRRRGRPVKAENLHATLAFVGSVDEVTHRCLAERAVGIKGQAFRFRLARLGYFPRSRTLWLAPEACPPELEALVHSLNTELSPCGYRPEPRAHHPHLTLLRNAAPASMETPVAIIDWRVDDFCLVESKTCPKGAHYRVLRRYPLPR